MVFVGGFNLLHHIIGIKLCCQWFLNKGPVIVYTYIPLLWAGQVPWQNILCPIVPWHRQACCRLEVGIQCCKIKHEIQLRKMAGHTHADEICICIINFVALQYHICRFANPASISDIFELVVSSHILPTFLHELQNRAYVPHCWIPGARECLLSIGRLLPTTKLFRVMQNKNICIHRGLLKSHPAGPSHFYWFGSQNMIFCSS